MLGVYKEQAKSVQAAEKIHNSAMWMAENAGFTVQGNYAKTRNFDEMLRPIFPFFYFPSRSIPFYLRTGIEHPWTIRGLTLYEEHTREPGKPAALIGYMKVPGLEGIYINPFRPMMGYQFLGAEPLTGISQPVMGQVQTAFSMFGFSLAPYITLGAELASRISEVTGGPQLTKAGLSWQESLQLTRGEPMPILPQFTWARNAAQFATGKYIPEPTQVMFGWNMWPDWYQRQMEKELANMGIDPAVAFSQYATPEMEQAKSDAARNLAGRDLWKITVPIRFRHPKELMMYQDMAEALEDYGISKDKQVEIRENGISPMQYLNNHERRNIYLAHPEWEVWTGVISPFLSHEEREAWQQTREFWVEYTQALEEMNENQVTDSLKVRTLDPLFSRRDWRENYSNRGQYKASLWEILANHMPLALITDIRRDSYRAKYGKPIPPIHLEDTAVQAYYGMEPPLDLDTGQPDLMELQVMQDEFLDSLPPYVREYVIAEVDRPRVREDPVEAEWRKDRRKLREWFAVRGRLLQQYPEWDRMMKQLRHLRGTDPLAARLLTQSAKYKQYSNMLTEARKALRTVDAELEYILIKWGISGVTSPINPETLNYFK